MDPYARPLRPTEDRVLIQPSELGAPTHLGTWRPLQEYALNLLAGTGKRFPTAVLPVGTGKTLLGFGYAKLLGARALYLTGTKGLQDQIVVKDRFPMADVRGMNNYPCKALGNVIKCDAGPCLEGETCVYRNEGCFYFDAVRRAAADPFPVSNYDFWFAHPDGQVEGAGTLGPVDLLICDEAHMLPEKVAAAAGCSFSAEQVEITREMQGWGLSRWRLWAEEKKNETIDLLDRGKNLSHSERRDLRALLGKFTRLTRAEESAWAFEWNQGAIPSVRFEPIDPADFAEQLLFRGISRVLLMSATVRKSTLTELGIKDEDAYMFECPSPFPVERRPVYWWPIGVRVNAKTSQTNLEFWVSKIDQAIKPRLGTKGLIHTMSYARAKFLQQHSRYGEHMVLHTSQTTRGAVEQFKRMSAPAILVSPSVHTGLDFPDDEARWQIVGKIPIPDTRGGIAAARAARNPDYAVQQAAIKLQQMTGRVVRSAQDLGETIIIDDTMRWLWYRYRPLFALWWREAFRQVDVLPPPPKFSVDEAR